VYPFVPPQDPSTEGRPVGVPEGTLDVLVDDIVDADGDGEDDMELEVPQVPYAGLHPAPQ
jgi:hypothetical protein